SSPARRTGNTHNTPPSSTTTSASRTNVARREVVGRGSDPELLTRYRTLAQLLRRAREDDHALLHDVAAVAHAQRDARVLLDEEDRHALALQLGDDVADVPHERRRQALRRLVHQDDPRTR